MESIRDRLRVILENSLTIEFKNHEDIKKMNLAEAKVLILDPVIEDTVDQILDVFKDFKK